MGYKVSNICVVGINFRRTVGGMTRYNVVLKSRRLISYVRKGWRQMRAGRNDLAIGR